MGSGKCDTPDTSGGSSPDPVGTKNPWAADRAVGLVSPFSCSPFGSRCVWNGIGSSLSCVESLARAVAGLWKSRVPAEPEPPCEERGEGGHHCCDVREHERGRDLVRLPWVC